MACNAELEHLCPNCGRDVEAMMNVVEELYDALQAEPPCFRKFVLLPLLLGERLSHGKLPKWYYKCLWWAGTDPFATFG